EAWVRYLSLHDALPNFGAVAVDHAALRIVHRIAEVHFATVRVDVEGEEVAALLRDEGRGRQRGIADGHAVHRAIEKVQRVATAIDAQAPRAVPGPAEGEGCFHGHRLRVDADQRGRRACATGAGHPQLPVGI